MRQPMRRTTALLATAALALSLSACTAGQWVADSPPAAGVQVDNGGLKLRNFLAVTDGSGEAMLLGSITSRDEAVDVAVDHHHARAGQVVTDGPHDAGHLVGLVHPRHVRHPARAHAHHGATGRETAGGLRLPCAAGSRR